MSKNKQLSIQWQSVEIKPKDLTPHERNPRKISKEKFEKLKQRIISQGFRAPVTLDHNRVILAGHQRVKALIALGLGDVPIRCEIPTSELTEEKRKEILAADNLSWGEYDFDILSADFELDQLIECGFDEKDLNFEITFEDGLTDENAVPDAPIEPKTKTGDIYILGNHRVMCGDSTNANDVEKLLTNGVKPNLMVADPSLESVTTLIASEKSGRICYGMEIDPTYVDIIVKRWEDFTGKKAQLENNGDKNND